MKQLWKYRFYSEITRTIEEGKPLKQPYVWSVNIPDADYDQVLDHPTLLARTKELYYKYEVDGIDYFRTIRADLVIDYRAGTRTSSDIFFIETTLKPVTDRLILGDWMSGQYELSLITPSGALDQALYDQISQHINDYIASNY
jgi:hypothetical protein